ncbi:GDSL-type esterase/lipase family protein [Sphingomonas sp. 1P06PA]|uniref:SGNH/GDSL hydrolase family protein n=1 Tax=Sphingomonas sp. 1P06PA TaxID=554121 RepID=UPI0039A59682
MRTWLALADRTLVLFLGIAAGALIAVAFFPDAPPAPPPPVIVPQAPDAPSAGSVAPAAPDTAPGAAAAPTARPLPSAALVPGAPSQQLVETVAGGGPVRIGVFGDSFGDGVWSGLNRQLGERDGYDVVKFSQQATGFTRYKRLNLETHAAEQLGDRRIDIAVISYGANDTQGVITSKGKYAALMSPEWQAEIGARVDGFVRLMREHGATVFWVGLPRMRKPSFDADIAAMNAFYQARMAALGVPFIETVSTSAGSDGGFATYLIDPADAKRTLIRADDGIHMSMTGYVWITRGLAGRIKAEVEAARRIAGKASPPAPATPPARETAA